MNSQIFMSVSMSFLRPFNFLLQTFHPTQGGVSLSVFRTGVRLELFRGDRFPPPLWFSAHPPLLDSLAPILGAEAPGRDGGAGECPCRSPPAPHRLARAPQPVWYLSAAHTLPAFKTDQLSPPPSAFISSLPFSLLPLCYLSFISTFFVYFV